MSNRIVHRRAKHGNCREAVVNAATNNYTANELNQYVEIANGAAIEPIHDDDGNMVEYGVWSFTWDGENRLIEVASNNVTVVQNHYDYMSRRIMKATATATNTFVYDGWNMIREIAHTPAPPYSQTSHYVWGLDLSQTMQGAGGVGGLLAVSYGGSLFCPAYDANGNITEYVNAAGAAVAHYEYDPFGNVSAHSGSMADTFVYRFSTKYTDKETGLVYYGYRFYNPELGRWLNRDPIGELGGLSLYNSGGNNLANSVDILGLLIDEIANPDGPFPEIPSFSIGAGGVVQWMLESLVRASDYFNRLNSSSWEIVESAYSWEIIRAHL